MRILPLIAAFGMAAAAACSAGATSIAAIDMDEDAGAVYGDYLSARFAADHHDLDEAAKYFLSGLDQDPKNPQLLTLAFFYSASAGEIDQAVGLAKRLVVSAPDDRAARLTLAIADLKEKEYRDARAEIAQSAKGPFTSFTVALIDAWAAAGQGDAASAAADLKSLHALHSADGLAYFNEAMLAELLGQKDIADADYKLALQAVGPTPRVVDAYGRFLERNGRAPEARTLYEKFADDEGFSAVVGPGLARIAAGTVPDPLAPMPADGAAEALFGVAASLNDEPSRDVSILYLRLALYLEPKLDLASILLANRFENMEKYEEAIATYKTIRPDSPYAKIAAVEIAVNQARLDKIDDAIAGLKALAAQYPSDVETWTALGDCYRQAKQYADATKAYDKAIVAASPPTKKNWPLYYARAISEQESNNWPAAEADLKQSLVLSPDEPQVLNYLGYSWVDQRRNIPEALTMLEKARSLDPQDGYIIDSVGWAYYRLGRYADAAKALEDAIQLVPGDPTINDHLGDAYWKVGRKLDARFQWSHALAFGADDGEKAEIEKKLQSGLGSDDRS